MYAVTRLREAGVGGGSCLQFPGEMNKYSLIRVLKKTEGQIEIAQMDAFNIHLS